MRNFVIFVGKRLSFHSKERSGNGHLFIFVVFDRTGRTFITLLLSICGFGLVGKYFEFYILTSNNVQ